MSKVLDLTSFDQIRGVLSVSSADLPDEVLEPFSLEDDLAEDLDAFLGDWESVRDGSDDKASRTLRLYAKYRCACIVAVSAQNFMYTQMSDGSNSATRSEGEGFEALREQLEYRARAHQEKLLQNVDPGEAASEGGTRPIFGSVTPGRDPVTEARSSAS